MKDLLVAAIRDDDPRRRSAVPTCPASIDWLHRISVHACYAEAKRDTKWSANVVILPVDGPVSPDTTQDVDTRDALDRAFRRLPPEQRAAFVLHHDLGRSVGRSAISGGMRLRRRRRERK